jgi:hypothetical protein
MAMIKSALELALERTKDLKVDEAAIEASNIKNDGRRAAGQYIENFGNYDLTKAVKEVKSQRELFRRSACEVFIAQIQLPGAYYDPDRMSLIGSGLAVLASLIPEEKSGKGAAAKKQVEALTQQIKAFMEKYLEELKRVEQAIRSQWAPKLREKEMKMAARMGQDIRLDPMADPEFAAFYKQNVEALRNNYTEALERAKQGLKELLKISETEN